MDNDKINELINGIGALSEMWSIAYTSFLSQGLDPAEAAVHTKMLFKTLLEVSMDN